MSKFKKNYQASPGYFIALLVLFNLYACVHISPYNHSAYQQAISLKVESLALISKATESYAKHAVAIDDLKLKMEKAYEYNKQRPHNEHSIKQWEIMRDANRNLLGGFLTRWEKENKLSPFFIKEVKVLIGEAFDTISGLESGKNKKKRGD